MPRLTVFRAGRDACPLLAAHNRFQRVMIRATVNDETRLLGLDAGADR